MIDATIVRLTARQLLGQRRTILMVLFAVLPVLVAVLFRFAADDDVDRQRWTATVGLGRLVVGLLLPLAALVFGTAALGTEFEDGTAVYLLSKPIPRSAIVLSKLLVAFAATAVTVVVASVAVALVANAGEPQAGIALGFAVGSAVGALVYCAAFVWLSIATSRALIAGLLYVFIWEGTVANLFDGVRYLSIRQYALGVADIFVSLPARAFNPRLDPAEALVMAALVCGLATWAAIRALQRWQIGESS